MVTVAILSAWILLAKAEALPVGSVSVRDRAIATWPAACDWDQVSALPPEDEEEKSEPCPIPAAGREASQAEANPCRFATMTARFGSRSMARAVLRC